MLLFSNSGYIESVIFNIQITINRFNMKKNLLFLAALFCCLQLSAQTTIYDWEAPATSVEYKYFGNVDLSDSVVPVIANPNASGINTSANVLEYTKRAGSEVWAGAYADPGPTVDVSSGEQVCIKVHFDHIGNVALKLENSTTGGDDWILTKANTTTGAWEEICYDTSLPSIEAPFTAAAGNVYTGLVFFVDFGVVGADQVTYLDDFTVQAGSGGGTADLTLSVDMNEYGDAFTQPYVSGAFNDWSGDANPMEDPDMDGVWTVTLPGLATGAYEYKFTLDNWSAQEQFNGTDLCTKTTFDGDNMFVNRLVVLTENTTADPVCWNSCYGCGEGVSITFNLGMTQVTPSEDGVYIAGGGNFDVPGGPYRLMDPDGDNIFSLTIEREAGFSSYYTFANGACGDFSCKENIAGQDCADPANFNDRFLEAVMMDTEVNTCFGECTTTTDCSPAAQEGNITFAVDMNDSGVTIGTSVYVSGSINGWSGDANPLEDADGDGVWEGTITVPGGAHQFKFTVDNWAVQEEFMGGEDCTVTDGAFTNRALNVDGDDSFCFTWNTCMTCATGVSDLVNENLVQVYPNPVAENTLLQMETTSSDKELRVFDALGKLVWSQTLDGTATQLELNTAAWHSGIYLLHIEADNTIATKRLIKQ